MAPQADLTWWDVAGGYVLILIVLAGWALASRAIWRRSRTWVYGPRFVVRVAVGARRGQLVDLTDATGVTFLTTRAIEVTVIAGRWYAQVRRPWPMAARVAATMAPLASALLAGWLA